MNNDFGYVAVEKAIEISRIIKDKVGIDEY